MRGSIAALPLAVAFGACLAPTSVRADATLPLVSDYGDEEGCKVFKREDSSGPATDAYTYLSPDSLGRHESVCRFAAVFEVDAEDIQAYPESRVWTVVAVCAREGEVFSELVSIQEHQDGVTIRRGDNEPVLLHRCQ